MREGRLGTFTVMVGLVAALLLSNGCATKPDPVETRESITEAAVETDNSPEPSEYDYSAHPDPIVEPLECTPVLAITARGTGEPHKGQLLSPVVRAISEAFSDRVQSVDVDYPADTEVNEGGTRGVRWVLDTLRVQGEACPLQRFVLLGYSQGALVIGDALDAPERRVIGTVAGALPEEITGRIAAVVLYGNPRFVGAETHNSGTYSPQKDGIMPRDPAALDAYAERMRDFCEARDFICQASFDIDEEGHVKYYDNGTQQAGAAFAIRKLSEAAVTRVR